MTAARGQSPHIVFNRRRFLAAASGLIAAGLLPRDVLALAGPHTFKQGAFEITVVSDGHLVLPVSILATNADAAALKALLAEAGVTGDEVQVATNPVLIKSGSDLIVFDTGSGTTFQPSAGKLVENLKAAGIDPGAVTKVVFTHAHLDHIGGTLGTAHNFPNAAYYVAGNEWNFWMDKDLIGKAPKEFHPFILGAQQQMTGMGDKATMIKPGDEIVSGIKVLDTPGHTPGHVSFEVAGDGGLVIMGDVIASPATGFPHPEWTFAFDSIPDQAVATRKAILDRAANEKLKLLGFHWPYPGLGHAEKKDTAYRYVPAT